MRKLTTEEEKEILNFIKDWLKVHGYSQKDLSNELKIKSSRSSEILLKIKELYKKGGMYNVAKNLIKIEQNWINNTKTEIKEIKKIKEIKEIKEIRPYNQLDIDSLVNQIEKDSSE